MNDLGSLNIGYANSLRILSLNIRSIPKHSEHFLTNFHFSSFDSVGFSETRLTNYTAPVYKIQSYDMFSQRRSASGSGIVLYLKHNFKAAVIKEL